MSTTYRPYAPDQDLLLQPRLQEWLPEGHLSYFINDVIEELDLGAFYKPYEGDGRRKAPYEPRMMLKVLIYAYATGVFSSRKIAKKLEEDVAFRVLAADNFPQHRTICDFRKRHLSDFKAVFVQVIQIAQQAELISLGTIAIDGTKVRANASKHKAMSYQRLQAEERRLAKEVAQMCAQARSTDANEDQLYGVDHRGDELPEELHHRQSRLTKIRDAKALLEQAQREADTARGRHKDDDRKPPGRGRRYKRDFGVPEDKAQSNFTDPQSSIMQTAEGFQQCYNGQLAVDRDFQIIVENKLTANASDNGELLEVLAGVENNLDRRPEAVLADAGYRDESRFKVLEQRHIDGYIALKRKDKDSNEIDVKRYPATGRMAEKLASADGRECYAERKWISEAVNGWIKRILGFRQFSVRGLNNASGEWDLVCLATNLRRMQPLIVLQ
jgi:transposase